MINIYGIDEKYSRLSFYCLLLVATARPARHSAEIFYRFKDTEGGKRYLKINIRAQQMRTFIQHIHT